MNTSPAQTKGYSIENLTRPEIARIKRMVLGYGKFKQTAEKTGLSITTFRDIINKGYGVPENIAKIRESLFEQAVA